jgi:GLPGLI family protein
MKKSHPQEDRNGSPVHSSSFIVHRYFRMKFPKILVLLSFSLVPFLCKSQIRIVPVGDVDVNARFEATVYDTLDYAKMRCQYTQFSSESVAPNRKIKDVMLLQIGDRVSKYLSYNGLIRDSILHAKAREGINGMDLLPVFESVLAYKSHDNSRTLKGYPENKITFINFFAATTYAYEEPAEKQNWQLLPDTATILGYECKKAVCTFRCRDYVAWYAPEIPVSEGPWKFFGLPGLILKVHDANEEFHFLATAIEKISWADPITVSMSSAHKITKQNYLKAYKNYN